MGWSLKRVTLRAAHAAFHSDKPDKRHPPDALLPYRYHVTSSKLMNLYDLELHRDAPARFAELRSIWGIEEAEYTREVRSTVYHLLLTCSTFYSSRK